MYKTLKERYKPERQWPANSSDPFPMEGDILILQFINTHRNRDTNYGKDLLEDYGDFLNWCWEFGVVDAEEHETLSQEGYCYAHEANVVWQRARKLRFAMREFICCPMRGREIREVDLFYFNELVNEADTHLRFELDDNRPRQAWFEIDEQLGGPLWKLVKQAVYLLESKAFDHIKKCRCGNLYLDTTHGKNRRWCNPLTCGQNTRMKAYRKRKVAERLTEDEGPGSIKIETLSAEECVGG